MRPSVSLVFFLTLIRRAARTQRNSPGVSTRRGHRTYPSEYYQDGHNTCLFLTGPPTHSVGSQYCFALWHLSLSVVCRRL